MTDEYEAALETIREATATFELVRKAYRAGTIGDSVFLSAKAEYNEAEKAYDVAYAKEAKGDA